MHRLLLAVQRSARRRSELIEAKQDLLRARFAEQARQTQRKAAAVAPVEGSRRPAAAVARGRHAAPRRGVRPLSAGRVRRRPQPGLARRGQRRVPRPGRVLPPHLPHRRAPRAARQRRSAGSPARAATRSSSCRPTSAAARPTRCSRSTTSAAGTAAARACRASRRCSQEAGVDALPTAQRAVLVGTDALARRSPRASRTARWSARCGASWPGSSAARRATRSSPRPTEHGTSPGEALARAVPAVRALPDPDRRVGRLRPPALRRRRPARRLVRRSVHLRPGAHRGGREPCPAALLVAQHPGLGHRGRRRGRTRGARRAARTSSAAWNRRGGRPAPRRASRSSAGGCSSRSPSRLSAGSATPSCAAFGELYRPAGSRVPARVPRRRLRAPDRRRPTRSTPSCSTGSTRTGRRSTVPAHPRRPAPDGGGHPRALGARGPAAC